MGGTFRSREYHESKRAGIVVAFEPVVASKLRASYALGHASFLSEISGDRAHDTRLTIFGQNNRRS